MDQAITRAAGATQDSAPRAVGEFQGYVDGKPHVTWFDNVRLAEAGDVLCAAPRIERKATAFMPRRWSLLLTSENHGVIGPLGSTFSHAGERHERVVVVEVPSAAGAPVDQVDLVLRSAAPAAAAPGRADLTAKLDEVHAWARQLPIPTPGTVMAMHKLRTVKEALAGAPVAAQAGQVAVPEGWAQYKRELLGAVFDLTSKLTALPTLGVGQSQELISREAAMELVVQWRARTDAANRVFGKLAAAPSAPAVAQQAPVDSTSDEHQAVLDKQVAAWRKERARLDDLIATATGAQASTAGERQEGGAA